VWGVNTERIQYLSLQSLGFSEEDNSKQVIKDVICVPKRQVHVLEGKIENKPRGQGRSNRGSYF